MALKFYGCMEKRLKLKVKSVKGSQQATILHFPNPPILNRVESKLKDSRPVKTVKNKKYMFHCFIDCRVEPTQTPPLYQKICLGTLNQLCLPTGEQGSRNCAVELACLQMLNISLHKIFIYLFILFKVGIILVSTNKNQPTN